MKIDKLYYIYIYFFFILSFSKCFLFSVIISIYNTGRYLDDAIGSLINQTIDFKNIQVILVNDGSEDQTEEICLKYQKKYKNNIIYIKIDHSGVSKARNIGLNYTQGEFINFLDSDDKWDYKAFEYIIQFFEKYNNIDFVAGRIKFFENEHKYHPLDYKFYETRVVNLSKEYDCIQLSASSSFFRKSLLEGKYFKEGVEFCEDARFVNNILLYNPIMGLVKESIYYYRRRSDLTSAINNQKQNLEYYFGTTSSVLKFLINISKTLYNEIVPFIQFLICYDLFFRIQSSAYKFLDINNYKKYILIIKELLSQLEDKYILEQKILSNEYKIFMLTKKYNNDLRYNFKLANNSLNYSKYILIDLKEDKNIIIWKRFKITKKRLNIEGVDKLYLHRETYSYFLKIGNKTFLPKYYENSKYDFYTMFGLVEKGRIISFEIPLETSDESQILYFYFSYMGVNEEIFFSSNSFFYITEIMKKHLISKTLFIKYISKRFIIYNYKKKLDNKSENILLSLFILIKFVMKIFYL